MNESNTAASKIPFNPILLFALVFCTGCGIMVIELLGPRILAPSFGLSLTVWTAVITVAMIAMSVGYTVGGRFADKHPTSGPMFLVIGLAAVWTGLIPVMARPVLLMTQDMSDEVGTIVCSLILFVPPILALAMVGPYIIRLLTDAIDEVGGKAGTVYAVSTVGSVLGSVATGFWLIPFVGVRMVLMVTAGILLAISAAGLLASRKTTPALILLVLCAGAIGISAKSKVDRFLELQKADLRIHEEISSPYAELKIVDHVTEKQKMRVMFIGLGQHTVVNDGEVDLTYAVCAHLIPALRPEGKEACLIGLGGGALVHLLNGYGIHVDSVEIDQDVADLAEDYFGVGDTDMHAIHIVDGRRHFIQSEKTYDVIFNDAFGSGTAPFHLFTKEFLELNKARLNPGGMVVMNYLGFTEQPYDRGIASVYRTLQDTFTHVAVMKAEQTKAETMSRFIGEDGSTFSNYLFFASEEPIELGLPDELAIPDLGIAHDEYGIPRPLVVKPVGDLADVTEEQLVKRLKRVPDKQMRQDAFATWERVQKLKDLLGRTVEIDPARGDLVTDDRNPLDVYNIPQNRIIRKIIHKVYPAIFP
jgi:spermidine synthase